MHYLVGISHFAKHGTKRPLIVWEMLTNVQKSNILQCSGCGCVYCLPFCAFQQARHSKQFTIYNWTKNYLKIIIQRIRLYEKCQISTTFKFKCEFQLCHMMADPQTERQNHSVLDEDAVSWLTNYGKWHAYEKKKKCAVTKNSNCPPLLMDGAGDIDASVYRVDVPLRTSHIAHLNASAEFL